MSYLGNKGYTIPKEYLDINEQVFIRKTLIAKPYIPKSPVQPKTFPVYRESNNKLYIPRYFGIEHYGNPEMNKLYHKIWSMLWQLDISQYKSSLACHY